MFSSKVFYVPLRNEFNEHGLNINPDVNDLTKCFDEDLSNKHLVVVCEFFFRRTLSDFLLSYS